MYNNIKEIIFPISLTASTGFNDDRNSVKWKALLQLSRSKTNLAMEHSQVMDDFLGDLPLL